MRNTTENSRERLTKAITRDTLSSSKPTERKKEVKDSCKRTSKKKIYSPTPVYLGMNFFYICIITLLESRSRVKLSLRPFSR